MGLMMFSKKDSKVDLDFLWAAYEDANVVSRLAFKSLKQAYLMCHTIPDCKEAREVAVLAAETFEAAERQTSVTFDHWVDLRG